MICPSICGKLISRCLAIANKLIDGLDGTLQTVYVTRNTVKVLEIMIVSLLEQVHGAAINRCLRGMIDEVMPRLAKIKDVKLL